MCSSKQIIRAKIRSADVPRVTTGMAPDSGSNNENAKRRVFAKFSHRSSRRF